jgi:hypothetical protein
MRWLKALIVAAAMTVPAAANVITFETAPIGVFTGPVTESGFTYELGIGNIVVNTPGHPGQDLEAVSDGGGVLIIRRADGGLFQFDSVDFAAYNRPGTGTQDLIVAGGIGGGFIGFDVFTLANTADQPYSNWTTETALGLHGILVDTLLVLLGGGTDSEPYNSAIDNVTLTPDVPEPASLALLAGGLVFLRRRRRI